MSILLSTALQLLTFSKGNIDEAGRTLMAEQDVAFDNVYSNILAIIDGHAGAKAAFNQSLTDAINVLTAPLEHDNVESTISSGHGHVTHVTAMGEQVMAYQDYVKQYEATMANCRTEWDDLQAEMARLGIQVRGKESFATSEALDTTMTDTFVQSMERLNLEHSNKVDELARQMNVVDERLITDQRAAEEVSLSLSLFRSLDMLTSSCKEFDITTRSAKAMLLKSLI